MQKFKSVKKLTCIVIAVMMVLSCVVVGTNAVNTVKVAFTNNKNWGAVNVYTWDANFNSCSGAWPGTPVTSTTVNNYGETVYHAEIPANVTGIVFNDGGSQQTVDIHSFNGQSIGWYMTDQDANNGHWNVETWDYTPEESNTTSPTDTGSYKTIYFTNDKNWNVTAYAWDSANNALLGTWPGTAMTRDYTNDFGQDVYKITVSASAVGVVFSDNGGAQTVDINPVDNTGYYTTEQDGEGNWEVNPWYPVKDNGQIATTAQITADTSRPKTVYFTNDKGWSSVTAYAWNSSDAAVIGDWPGTAMTKDYVNSFGQDVYKITLPAAAIGVVFSNNGNNQTVDITPIDNTGYYGVEQNNDGYWEVASWTPAIHDETTGPTTTFDTSEKTVYFTNNEGWTDIKAYAWDYEENPLLGDWPGTAMTKDYTNSYGQDVYRITIPQGAIGVVFSNNGNAQTVDITPADDTGYYCTEQNGEGKWEVQPWSPVKNTEEETTAAAKTVYFTNNQDWTNVKAYAWDKNDQALLGDWPGTAMTFDYKNTFNQDVFKIVVPAGAVGVVFSNNGGAQTVDLVPADNTGYYPDSQEALGKWICKTWAPVHDVPTTVEVTTVEETTIEEPTVEESTIEETTVEPNAPIYVDNFSASSYSISLKDSIAINFRVKPETVLGYTDPYLVVTMNNEETVINDYETLADGTLVFQFDKVYPQTVIDDASSVLHGFKGDQEYYGAPYTKSVLEYAINNQAKEGNSHSLKGLLVNLLKYAAEAQKFVHYKEDNLASDYINPNARRFAKSILTDLVDVKDFNAVECPGTVKSEFTTATLVLGNTVGIKVTFTANDITDKSIRVDFNGESKYFEAEDLAPANAQDKATFTYSLYANQLHDTVRFTVCEGTDHTPISDTMTYSAASYASKFHTDPGVGPLLTELMLYGQAAETFANAQ